METAMDLVHVTLVDYLFLVMMEIFVQLTAVVMVSVQM